MGKNTDKEPRSVPTAKALRQRVADVTTTLKGHQKRWRELVLPAAADEPGARERLAAVEQEIAACDRDLALLGAAIEQAELRETHAARVQAGALSVELADDYEALGRRFTVALDECLPGCSLEVLERAYVLMRQREALRNTLDGVFGGPKYRGTVFSLSAFGSWNERRVRTMVHHARPSIPAPWRAAVDELKALQRELGIDNRPLGDRDTRSVAETPARATSPADPESAALQSVMDRWDRPPAETEDDARQRERELEGLRKMEADVRRSAVARHGGLRETPIDAVSHEELTARPPRPGSPMALRREQ